jgi:hypothetical protein
MIEQIRKLSVGESVDEVGLYKLNKLNAVHP